MPAPTDAQRIRAVGICDTFTGSTVPADAQVFLARATPNKDVLMTMAEARNVLGDGALLAGNFNATAGAMPVASLNDFIRIGTPGTIGGTLFSIGEWWRANQDSAGGAVPAHWNRVRFAGAEFPTRVYSPAHGLTSASNGKQIGWDSTGAAVVVMTSNQTTVQAVAALIAVIDANSILICTGFQVAEVPTSLLPIQKLIYGASTNDRIYTWKLATSTYDHANASEPQTMYYIGDAETAGLSVVLMLSIPGFTGGGALGYQTNIVTIAAPNVGIGAFGFGQFTLSPVPTQPSSVFVSRLGFAGAVNGETFVANVGGTVDWKDAATPLIIGDKLQVLYF